MKKLATILQNLGRDMIAVLINFPKLFKLGGNKIENAASIEHLCLYSNVNRNRLPLRKKQGLKSILFPSKGSLASGSETFISRPSFRETSNHQYFYINGILTNLSNAQYETDLLAMLLKAPVFCIYNPTRGFLIDVVECVLGRTLNARTAIADDAYRWVRDVLNKDANMTVTLIGHSQGGIILSNIIDNFVDRFGPEKSAELLKRVTFVTFGSGDDGILSEVDVPNIVQVKNTGDFVANLALEDQFTGPERKGLVVNNIEGHDLAVNYLGHTVHDVKRGEIKNTILERMFK